MNKYAAAIPDRKTLVRRIAQLTGLVACYTRMPRCTYEIGAYTVEKDGSLTVQDDADNSLIQILQAENLIGDSLMDETEAPIEAVVNQLPSASMDDSNLSHPAETEAQQEENDGMDSDAPNDPASEDIPSREEAAEAIQEEPFAERHSGFPMDAEISFPLVRHSPATLTNLICLIYSRGPLLEKATGGTFHADRELVDTLLDQCRFHNTDALIKFVTEWEDTESPLSGIRFTEDKIIIDGFKGVRDAEHLETFTKLAAAMNKMALTQKRIQAKDVDAANEKYALRIWLIRLGMNGSDTKDDRRRLMENLSGHTAFRTEEEKERAKAKAIRKRDALRALKAENAAQSGTAAEEYEER